MEYTSEERAKGLALLRGTFPIEEIELLPKYTGPKENGKVPQSAKRSCEECGGYHGFPCVHLSYVGHAGVTKRLLEVDPEWNWKPLAMNTNGTPQMSDGGMWIELTVLGMTRYGFGDAEKPTAIKEIIGDAIRNAAMRFGCALYLWSKSEAAKAELTRAGVEDETDTTAKTTTKTAPKAATKPPVVVCERLKKLRQLISRNHSAEAVIGQLVEWGSLKDAPTWVKLNDNEKAELVDAIADDAWPDLIALASKKPEPVTP